MITHALSLVQPENRKPLPANHREGIKNTWKNRQWSLHVSFCSSAWCDV